MQNTLFLLFPQVSFASVLLCAASQEAQCLRQFLQTVDRTGMDLGLEEVPTDVDPDCRQIKVKVKKYIF
jgi:hypothetical protein